VQPDNGRSPLRNRSKSPGRYIRKYDDEDFKENLFDFSGDTDLSREVSYLLG